MKFSKTVCARARSTPTEGLAAHDGTPPAPCIRLGTLLGVAAVADPEGDDPTPIADLLQHQTFGVPGAQKQRTGDESAPWPLR